MNHNKNSTPLQYYLIIWSITMYKLYKEINILYRKLKTKQMGIRKMKVKEQDMRK